jgi:plastocyanin
MTLALSTTALATSEHRTVQMLDACDGPSFNAVIGEGTCERAGGVTFDEFIGQLLKLGEAPSWRFSPTHMRISVGGEIEAHNRGGEFHTFTEVANFGGGCVPELNELLGLTPVPECANPALFGTTGAAPGGEVATEPLAAGTHTFMCLIHPWMRTTVMAD